MNLLPYLAVRAGSDERELGCVRVYFSWFGLSLYFAIGFDR